MWNYEFYDNYIANTIIIKLFNCYYRFVIWSQISFLNNVQPLSHIIFTIFYKQGRLRKGEIVRM